MEPISGIHERQMQPIFRMKEKEAENNGSVKPVVDEFIREEHTSAGLYRVEKDEDGNPKIHFDDPDRAAGKNDEICKGSTDKVDREIEKLKQKKEELEANLNTETDETKKKELESKLAQVERELRQKDNDTYRRQHMVFS